jgi:hypothetical protein
LLPHEATTASLRLIVPTLAHVANRTPEGAITLHQTKRENTTNEKITTGNENEMTTSGFLSRQGGEHANAAARNGATGFVSTDSGWIAYQTDTGQYWCRCLPAAAVAWNNVTLRGAGQGKTVVQA